MLHSLFPMTREVVCHPDPTDQTLLSQPGNNNVRNWGKERWGWLEQEIIRYFSGQYLIKSLKSISTSLPSLKYFSLLLFSLLIFVLTTSYLSASHTEIYTLPGCHKQRTICRQRKMFSKQNFLLWEEYKVETKYEHLHTREKVHFRTFSLLICIPPHFLCCYLLRWFYPNNTSKRWIKEKYFS